MRKALKAALVVIVLFAGWVLLLVRWVHLVQPAGPTLADHLAKMPPPEQRRVFTKGGREYLAVFGPIHVLARFPSGPPVYVFDDAGRLADWTPDEGEDPAFHRQWGPAFSGREVTQAEVNQWPGASPQ
jgi:hypothetical protein